MTDKTRPVGLVAIAIPTIVNIRRILKLLFESLVGSVHLYAKTGVLWVITIPACVLAGGFYRSLSYRQAGLCLVYHYHTRLSTNRRVSCG